jgi:hypothetical protein
MFVCVCLPTLHVLQSHARLLVICCLFFHSALALAQQTSLSSANGIVTGVVSENETKQFLPGARLVVLGTNTGAVCDRRGTFRLVNVPTGTQKLVVSALGYASDTLDVNVEANSEISKTVVLRVNAVAMGEVTITGMLLGQAKAFNQQKNADNIRNVVAADLIGRFPDPNVADALQRVPGVSIDRD